MTKIEKLCNNILDRLITRKNISEDIVYDFINELKSTSKDKLPKNILELANKIDEMKQFTLLEKLGAEQAFLYGAIWSQLQALGIDYTKGKNKEIELTIRNYRYSKELLILINLLHHKPNLTREQLVSKSNFDYFSIKYLLRILKTDKLVTQQTVYSETYYSLTSEGEAAFKLFQDKILAIQKRSNIRCKKN